MPQITARSGLSLTTTHRIMQSLLRRGFLMRNGKADYRLGSSAVALTEGVSYRSLLPPAARTPLKALSRETRSHAHLGVWEEGMVAYLVKQRYGKVKLHSAEGARLEGYCSALGKVLLAGLSDDDFDTYVADGAFVPLTSNTIVDPHRPRQEIVDVRDRGWAADNEEIALRLRCVASR